VLNMRPSRGPYARRDPDTPWIIPSAGILLFLLVLAVPAYILFPDIFPGAMMWLLAAIAVMILAWTCSKEGRQQLRPRQVAANLGMVVVLVLFIISLAVKAPTWIIWTLTLLSCGLGVIAMYRGSD
jgi:peptidoglycan biosynthesis protein MviN/MurJ (putative lipid II flippase)